MNDGTVFFRELVEIDMWLSGGADLVEVSDQRKRRRTWRQTGFSFIFGFLEDIENQDYWYGY